MFNKQQKVYYPRAIVQGKPVETGTIVKDLAKISTVSNSDVQAVRIEFIPERTKLSNGTYTRALVDSDELEWIELSSETKGTMPGGEGGAGIWKKIR